MGLKLYSVLIFAFVLLFARESKCQYSGESQQVVWTPFVAASGADGISHQSDEDYYYTPADETSRERQKLHKRSFGSIFKPSYSHLVQQHATESGLTHRPPPRKGEFISSRGKKSLFPTFSRSRLFYPRKKLHIHKPKESAVDVSMER